MKLSSVAHNDNAHDDGVWAVCWSVDPETGEGVSLTGSRTRDGANPELNPNP